VRSLGIKVLNDKTFDRHMLKVKDLNPKKIHFLKFFKKNTQQKKSGNLNTMIARPI